MATQTAERIHIVTSFDAGVQRRTTKFLAQPTEVFFAKNVDFQYKLGGITKALGYEKKGNTIASGVANLGSSSLNTSAGTNKLISFAGTDAYVYNPGTGAWDAQSRSFTAAQRFETTRFLNQVFMVNGLTDAPENYNGSDWSTTRNVTDMPKGKYIIEDKLRVYVFNVSIGVGGAFASRFFYSDLPKNNTIEWGFESGVDLVTTNASAVVTSAGSAFQTRGIKVGDPFFITTDADIGEYEVKSIDSETQITLTEALGAGDTGVSFWVGGNWEDVARDNSDVGTGIGKNSDRVLFFKRFSLHKWSKGNSDDNTLIPVKGVPGTTSHRSITNVRDFTLYYADTGVWRYDGSSSQLISNPIQEVIDGVAASFLDKIVGWTVGERICKMFVGDVNNTDTGLVINKCVVCYDVFANTWWFEEYDDTISSSIVWVEDNAVKNFIFSADGEAFQSEKGNTYNSNAFPMSVETWFHYPIAPEVMVNMTRFKIYTVHGREITLKYKLAYFTTEGGYRVDSEWQRPKLKSKTEDEQEWVLPEANNRAAGYALQFSESSDTNARPAIERIAAFYTGGEVR